LLLRRLAVETGDPDPILWKLADAAGNLLWTWAKLRLRTVLEPELIKVDFLWDDLLPLLDSVTPPAPRPNQPSVR